VPCDYMAAGAPNSCLEQDEMRVSLATIHFKQLIISANGTAVIHYLSCTYALKNINVYGLNNNLSNGASF